MTKPSDDTLSAEETQRRMDAAVRRALNTPPQPKAVRKVSSIRPAHASAESLPANPSNTEGAALPKSARISRAKK